MDEYAVIFLDARGYWVEWFATMAEASDRRRQLIALPDTQAWVAACPLAIVSVDTAAPLSGAV